MSRKSALWQGLTNIFVFLLALSIIASTVLEANRSAVDNFFGVVSEVMVSEEGETYSAYKPDAQFLNADGTGNSTALIKAAIDLGRRQEAEGAVLLKNDGALPLASGSKVTLLGIRSHVTVINSGMGQKSQGTYITLEQALSATKTDFANTKLDRKEAVADYSFADLKYGGDGVGAGAGFVLNPTAIAAYEATKGNTSLQPRAGRNYTVGEISVADLTAAESGFVSSFAQYNDAAIVVVGRAAGESNDYLKGSLNESEKTATITEPLQLTQNERDIIDLACQNFSKVIVLLNNNSAIEIGDLKNNPKISAIMWIGHPGNYGLLGVADLLCGKVSPSGGLYDVYATSNLSAPAMMNMGDYTFANKEDITRSNRSTKYVMEDESIYVGYRYYETRYYDSVLGQGNAKSAAGVRNSKGGTWNYADEMAYGFGYGLSYTNFEFELSNPAIEQSAHAIFGTFTVKVTNKGTVAGKVPVQIYAQTPYTEYDKQHKVEKSAIQLIAFDKTDILEPGKSQTLTIRADFQNLASYDETFQNADGSKGTYILDNGAYYFAVGNGAHDALNNVLALQGKTTADGMDYNGTAALAKQWNYTFAGNGTVDGTTFGISKNNVQVHNQIQYINWNNFSGEKITHLTRADWNGTYPVEHTSMTAPADMIPLLDGRIAASADGKSYYTIHTNDDVSGITWGSTKTSYKFYEMVKADWDDYRWNDLLDQIALDEATVFASNSGPNFVIPLTGVGFVAFQRGTDNAGNGIVFDLNNSADKNAPWTIPETDPNAAWNGQVFGCAPIVASTFNQEIMFEIGNFVGNEALFVGLPIVWGPGLNTHRHAYNGRSGEYYSEDPVLSGACALEFAVAAGRKGLVASPKHFVFNDQETNRNGVAPFMTEQRAREIELRAYQIAMEGVKYEETNEAMFGLMTSFSKCGPVEVTNSWGMMTGILQNEWGFHGYAVTDISDDKDLYTGMVFAGCTGYDLRGGYPTGLEDFAQKIGKQAAVDGIELSTDMFAKDATMQGIIRTSLKRSLWAFAHSNLMNRYSASTHVESVMTPWRVGYTAAIAVTAVLALASAVMFILSSRKKEDA